jgi:hypothetical protein
MQNKSDRDIIQIQKKKETADVGTEEFIVLNSRVEKLKRDEASTIVRIQVMKDKIQNLQEARMLKKGSR